MKIALTKSRLLALAFAFCLCLSGASGPVRSLVGLETSTASAAGAGEPVTNGSFDPDRVSGPYCDLGHLHTGVGAGDLRVVGLGNSVDHIRGFWQPADGAQSVDLDGNAPGGIAQTLTTKAGQQYVLRFSYSANPDRLAPLPNDNDEPDGDSDDPCGFTLAGAKMSVSWGASAIKSETYTTANSKAAMNWQTDELHVTAAGTSTTLAFTSTDQPSACGIALDKVSVTPLITLSKPVIVRAVSNGSAVALTGRVDGGAGVPITFAVASSTTCSNGVLGGTPTPVGSFTVTPGPDTYFTVPLPAIALRSFVTVQAASPAATDASGCAVVGGENDSWPNAFQLDPTETTQDVIDSAGQSRWYRFDVQPGSRVTVSLTGLPTDYDLAVFKDISQAYTTLTSPQDLTKLSAEFAPSAFSPSAFSPSAFSPSAFSPDAYSPSAFSPSAFSSSVFSPSAFSPSAFSPSAFSPSAFSPSAFSPSAFSPSAFSPSAFSPSAFSPSAFSPDAFASAQTRSLVAISATPGTGDETAVADTWTNTGHYYVRVWGRNGAFSTSSPFTVTVTKTAAASCATVAPIGSPPASEPGGGYKTVILTDSSRLPGSTPDKTALQATLSAFAGRPEVQGAIVDLAGDSRIGQLNAQADASTGCPYAKNLVAGAIKDIVDKYRVSNPGLQYVVILGNDDAIPFFRYPDESLLGEESGYVPPLKSTTAPEAALRLDYVLGQDEYGSSTQISLGTSNFPVPDLAVGRLVETASEIKGMLDAYTDTSGVVSPNGPHSSLVTGYDFLADAANSVKADLAAGTGQTPDSLITPSNVSPQDPSAWTATQLKTQLLGTHHDLVFLAGHFSANSALAADFSTSLLTTDVYPSTANLKNSIVFSAGCHSGYNIGDVNGVPGVTLLLDWPQAFAAKQATLIAGTGYQYGDTDFIEYSERIYADFAKELRTGTGPISIGEALVRSKQQYLDSTPDIRGIHEKALLEATVYGLPMMSVNMPAAGRLPVPGAGSTINSTAFTDTSPGAVLGLHSVDLSVPTPTTRHTVDLSNLGGAGTTTATYYSGEAGTVSNPAEPTLPLKSVDVTPTDSSLVLRGVGFRGGSYADSSVVPLTGASTTELRGVHTPFVSPVFYPMRPWSVDYFSSLAGNGQTKLLITPAQHKTLSLVGGTSTLRLYSDLSLRLFYSGYTGASALSAAPDVVSVEGTANASGGVDFKARVVGNPAAGIQQVWVTYTGDGPSRWASLDLTQDTIDSTVWHGTLPGISSPGDLRFLVQAANGVGLVSLDDNLGAYFGVTSPQVAALTPTVLTLVSPPASGPYGADASVTATLAAGPALSGKTLALSVGSVTRYATTDGSGSATASIPLVSAPGSVKVTAAFAGDSTYAPSSASSSFTLGRATSSLSPFTAQAPVVLAGDATGVTTTVTAALGQKVQPLMQQTVKFDLTGPATKTFSTLTDYLGKATLPSTGLAPGTYSVTATFDGDSTYTGPVTQTGTLKITPPDHTPPAITFTGNKGTYALSDTVSIKCTTADLPDPAPSSGIKADPCPAFLLTGPAWSFKAGVNTLPSPGLIATDNAGNSSAPATTSFTVTVTPSSLCQLTRQFAQTSAKYAALKPAQKTVVDSLSNALCTTLAAIVPKLPPTAKAQLVIVYKAGVQTLVPQGWLTTAQAATLTTLAGSL